jgi:hypothetical protein
VLHFPTVDRDGWFDGLRQLQGARLMATESIPQGPYLQMAVICERVLREQDGVLSLIRVVDRLTHTIVGAELPDPLPPVSYTLWFALRFKSGNARGRQTLKIVQEQPSGLRSDLVEQSIMLEGEDRGTDFVGRVQMRLDQEGVYWFNVFLNDQFMTRMPLRLTYNLVRRATPPTPPTA